MLGPELETYRGNKLYMVGGVLLGVALAALAFVAYHNGRSHDFILAYLSTLTIPAFLLLWLKSLQVTLHSNGITYHSLFGEKEMRWDMAERFVYKAIKQTSHGVPIGTSYLFRLVDSDGNKIRFGNRIERTDKLAAKLVDLTTPELYRKAAKLYNRGDELDFGPIKMSRPRGLKIKELFHYKEIPWERVSSYALQKGKVYIGEAGKKRPSSWKVDCIPNVFVLLDLLKYTFPAGDAAKK
jgi:hypothetical protein